MIPREIVEGLVHDLTAQGGVGLAAERLQLFELKNEAREDLVRIGDPPLDARHA